jgi:hypothetical protein
MSCGGVLIPPLHAHSSQNPEHLLHMVLYPVKLFYVAFDHICLMVSPAKHAAVDELSVSMGVGGWG